MKIYNKNLRTKGTKGFTLIETIVALSLSVMIIMGAVQVFVQGLSHVRGVRAQALLTSESGYMVQVIRNELLGADSASVNPMDSSEVSILRTSDTSTFSVNDGRLEQDGVPVTNNSVTVSTLAFTEVGHSLRIQFTLWSGARTDKTFVGQTTIALR